MLIIRKEQFDVFRQLALHNFEDEMFLHLKQFNPKHTEIVSEPNVRQVIRKGMERAKKYGLTKRGPVRFYIELMYMLGSDFDTDPQYPWAEEILNDPGIKDQKVRADLLYDKAMEYIEKVAGPNNKFEYEALNKLSNMRFEDLPVIDNDLEKGIVMHLNRVYPQKCKYISQQAFRALIQRGNELAENFSLFKPDGIALLVGLMFSFGHGCVNDPQFPWIIGTLNNTSIAKDKRIERLYNKMITFLCQ